MAISRRGFLKSVGIGSLTKLASSSEENETSKKETKYDGRLEYDLAFHSLDFAEIFLKGLMNREYTGIHKTYASNIDSAARFVCTNVWSWRPPIRKVKRSFIPLLEKARDSIDLNDPAEIKKHNPKEIGDNADYPRFAMHVKACIQGRIYNLENYCTGEGSNAEDGFERVEKEGKYQFIK